MITLENRTAMMAKAIIPVLKDFKPQINNTNDRLIRQYWMMTRAHDRYNRLVRQTHKTFQIHHLALLMFKDYIMILVGCKVLLPVSLVVHIVDFSVTWLHRLALGNIARGALGTIQDLTFYCN